jgi:hypothetical protein
MKAIIHKNHPELENTPDDDNTLCALVGTAIEAWQSGVFLEPKRHHASQSAGRRTTA